MNDHHESFDLDTGLHLVAGFIGWVAAHFDAIGARLITVLTITVLIIKIYRMRKPAVRNRNHHDKNRH